MNSDIDHLPSEEIKKEGKEKKKRTPPPIHPFFEEFEKKYQAASSVEDKIHLAIECMKSALSQEGSPRFKEFWEIRRMCLPLFKEGIHSILKNQLWIQFAELSNEALRLKGILAEESSFAVEQIGLAIQAFEEDLKQVDKHLSETPPITFAEECQTLSEKIPSYEVRQRELNLLSTQASRIHSLRKEVMKTSMRIRDKNQFFKRLSEAGDKVFPRRKKLIQSISDDFLADVHTFIAKHFSQEGIQGAPHYVLREEIKALQGMAKILTLNTQAFTEARLKLSECWDLVKSMEKERKKEIASKKQSQQQNKTLLQEQMKAFSEKTLSHEEKKREFEELFKLMRNLDLRREDLGELRQEMETLRPLAQTRENPKTPPKDSPVVSKKLFPEWEERLSHLLKKADSLSVEELEGEYQSVQGEWGKILLSREEKDFLSQKLGSIQDLLLQRKEEKAGEEDLEKILEERKVLRQEIKSRLDAFRKTAGGSGFDFEQAMKYHELLDLEKERLEKMDEAIASLEERIYSE